MENLAGPEFRELCDERLRAKNGRSVGHLWRTLPVEATDDMAVICAPWELRSQHMTPSPVTKHDLTTGQRGGQRVVQSPVYRDSECPSESRESLLVDARRTRSSQVREGRMECMTCTHPLQPGEHPRALTQRVSHVICLFAVQPEPRSS